MASKARLEVLGGHLKGTSTDMSAVQKELEEALAQGVKDGKIPHGIVYATNRDGSFTYSFATGLQHYGVNEEPIQEDAILMLASQTKLLTSIAVQQVVEQGFIGLDDDVSPHLPELGALGVLTGFDDNDKAILEPIKNKITLRQLVTHTSGANYAFTPDIIKNNKQRGLGGTLQDHSGTILQRYDSAFTHQPGESWMYSPGLDWSGLLIKRLTGLDLEAWFSKHIFTPLSITGITFWPSKNPSLATKIPQLTIRTPEGKLAPFTEDTINTHVTEPFGGHGAYAQMSEYLKILRSLLANDGKLLKPSTVDVFFSPQLSGGAEAGLNQFKEAWGGMFIGEINPEVPWNHGLGGAIFMEDDVGRRKAGTMHWGGMVNPFWLIDRKAGIALTFGTQVLPPGDPGCKEMTGVVERAVYKMAGVEF